MSACRGGAILRYLGRHGRVAFAVTFVAVALFVAGHYALKSPTAMSYWELFAQNPSPQQRLAKARTAYVDSGEIDGTRGPAFDKLVAEFQFVATTMSELELRDTLGQPDLEGAAGDGLGMAYLFTRASPIDGVVLVFVRDGKVVGFGSNASSQVPAEWEGKTEIGRQYVRRRRGITEATSPSQGNDKDHL